MSPTEAAAIVWWWIGMIPAGVVSWQRRGSDGWLHVVSRALWWPVFFALSFVMEHDPWSGTQPKNPTTEEDSE